MKTKNSSKSSGKKGNNRPSSRKQISPSRHWEFVLNNYTKQDILALDNMCSSIVPVIVGQSEIGDSGTKHLQVQISFSKKVRPINILKGVLGHARCSFRKVRDLHKTRMYCSKDDTYDGNWRVSRGWGRPKPLALITYDILNDYQKSIADFFKVCCDPRFSRDIHWFWEPKGNMGKTILSTFFCDQRDALIIGGKKADCFYGVQKYIINHHDQGPEIVIIDVPRESLDYVSYSAIEKVKDGLFFSGKFDSDMVRFNRPHVIVFANEEPRVSAMSEDRWKIHRYGESMIFGA